MIERPKQSQNHPDFALMCEAAIEDEFQRLAADAERAGWPADLVATALVSIADHHVLARIANAETSAQIKAAAGQFGSTAFIGR